jgi:hypothetical protein
MPYTKQHCETKRAEAHEELVSVSGQFFKNCRDIQDKVNGPEGVAALQAANNPLRNEIYRLSALTTLWERRKREATH